MIAGASGELGTLPMYRKQFAAAGIPLCIADISDRPNTNGGGNLGYRVKVFRQYAAIYSDYRFIIFSDAFDVTFYGSKDDVLDKIPTTHLLHAAEKNCYPDHNIAARIPGDHPYRFANGGIVAGTPDSYIRWCDEAERHPQYNPLMLDQEFLNILVSEQSHLGVIDCDTELFFCLYGGYENLEFYRGLPTNTLYETHPNFVHANGRWTAHEMFDRYERSLASE